MSSLLVKVQKKMNLAAHRKVRQALEGEYASVFKGRSMDFDDLRTYAPGDDIKDIDWKASARSGQMLIRRYIAVRKNNILLVVDTGRAMAATAPSGESKRDITVLAAGAIVSVAQEHGNMIGMIAGDKQHIHRLSFKDSRPHAERILQYVNNNIRLDAPESNLVNVLDYVRRTTKKRTLMIVITDNLRFAPDQERLLRRLSVQHEMLFIGINDLDPSNANWNKKDMYDVNHTDAFIPQYIRSQKRVAKAYDAHIKQEWEEGESVLNRLGITCMRISSEDEAIPVIIKLLEKHKNARNK